MQYMVPILTILLLFPSTVIAQQKLPAGTTLDYKEGVTEGSAITPDGRRVEVRLSEYDQWWLKKD